MVAGDLADRLQRTSSSELELLAATPRHPREVHRVLAYRYQQEGRSESARVHCNQFLRRLRPWNVESRAGALRLLAELDKVDGNAPASKRRYGRAARWFRRAASTSPVPVYATQLLLEVAECAAEAEDWDFARESLEELARSPWADSFDRFVIPLRERIEARAPRR